MFLTLPYRGTIVKCIIVCIVYCTTSIAASKYEDIDPDFNYQDVSTCEKIKYKDSNICNNKSTKGNGHISYLPHFKTVVTAKTNGRLGNHLLSYMHLMRLEFYYNVTILPENVVKKSLDTFFKNFDNIQTVEDDACGYYEFFDQFDKAEENLIIDLFRGKSGIDVTIERKEGEIRIYPIEVAIKYGEEINAGFDSYKKQFIQNFKTVSKLLPSDCKYKVIHKDTDYQMKHEV